MQPTEFPIVQPIVNCEEVIGKTIGRRGVPTNPGHYGFAMQKTINQLQKRRLPRGVFRFRTHEEADQWLMNHLTRQPAN